MRLGTQHIIWEQIFLSQQKMQSTKFFNTEQQETFDRKLIQKKSDLGSYVSHLDQHINKAMSSQNRTIGRKKQNLLQTLQKMRDQIHKESQKSRKMEEFFYQHCEKILVTDISKWDSNKEFFTKVFQLYDAKIKQKQALINQKKAEVLGKKTKLKQLMRNIRKTATIEQLSQRLTLQKQERSSSKHKNTLETSTTIRIKTQSSLPSLAKGARINTLTSYEEEGTKSYMRPIKTEKFVEDSSVKQSLVNLLSWYKSDKSEYTWFEKMVFVDRNFKKIHEAILSNQI